MATEQVRDSQSPSQADQPGQAQGSRPAPGAYLIPEERITQRLRDAIHSQLAPKNADGTRKLDEQGQPALGRIVSARQDAHYKGRILMEQNDFMVQAVGKNEEFAVVHEKGRLTLVGDYLNDKARYGRLTGAQIEVHYKGETGNIYPASEKAKQGPALTVDAVMKSAEQKIGARVLEVATKYAEKIKAASTREAFMKEIHAAVGHSPETQRETAGPVKASSSDSKAKVEPAAEVER
jgi:hypothetical protein